MIIFLELIVLNSFYLFFSFRLSHGIAQSLKGLYVSFAAHFLKNAAVLLDQCNLSKIGEEEDEGMVSQESNGPRYEELYFGSGPVAEEKCSLLVTAILKTLHCVFLYDSQNFLSKERFETLMQPIVDQASTQTSTVIIYL